MTGEDAAGLVQALVEREMGKELPEWPGGWPNRIDLALLDAVFSIRARYGSSATTGVRGVVNRWQIEHPAQDLASLATYAGRESELIALLQNAQRLSGGATRPPPPPLPVSSTWAFETPPPSGWTPRSTNVPTLASGASAT